jgi:hypothetical protein
MSLETVARYSQDTYDEYAHYPESHFRGDAQAKYCSNWENNNDDIQSHGHASTGQQ